MEYQDVQRFEEFLKQFYEKDILSAAQQGKKSFIVDFSLLEKFDFSLADRLLDDPVAVLEAAQDAVKSVDLPESAGKIIPRFKNLPEKQNIRIRNLRSEHIGKFICIDGIVRRASEVRPEISAAVFKCLNCGESVKIKQTERTLKPPYICENEKCGSRDRFEMADKELIDTRWIVLEELYEVATTEKLGQIRIILREDLNIPEMQRKADPGNRLKIVGILKDIKKLIKGKMKTEMDICLEANYIEPLEIEWEEINITKEDEKTIKQLASDPKVYEKIVDSIAPSMYGLSEIKEAIALQLFGGVPRHLPDGTRLRGDIHILLVGDPACLVADERVIMADGTIMKIGEMGSSHLESINYNVHMAMGRNVGKAKVFHTYKKQPIIEIVTETGKSIKGTYNHPVLTVKNRCQSWRRLDEIKIGDRVQVLPKIECRKKTAVKTNWNDYPYHHKSWHIKIPKFVDEDMASIFGYIISDGWVRDRMIGFVINKNEMDILPKIRDAFKKCFGVPVVAYKKKIASPEVIYYEVNRTHLAKLLSFLNEKRVPDLIFQSGNSVVASFLAWLYEGDGCVFSKGRGRLAVSLKSNNIELLRDVQILLLRFGIHSRILWEKKGKRTQIKGHTADGGPSGSLMIRRSESVIKFWQNIGFVSEKKKNKLEEAVKYARSHIHRIHKKRTEKIVQIKKLPPQDVFDIEVPKYHRFVANGVVVHNTGKTQIMKLISKIIPRGRYVSGKGVTGVGLTCLVTKDEEFMGGWVLEAGAMVLCHKGLIAIDEFDKMNKDDQIAMHEAMSTQTISVAKASIIATLPAQTAVLAAANPKFGRFDTLKSINEQIDIPDTLLSRFDVKFGVKDIPLRETDEKIADHVIDARLRPETLKPVISPEFLRKYIAYARYNCNPRMTSEAIEKLKEFYLYMRSLYGEQQDVIAITLRQYEALMRLAEASARIRLADNVEAVDAERAIRIMRYSIEQLGYDQETGKIDIDRTEGTSASQRSKIHIILDIIDMLERKIGKPVPKEEVITSAEEQGVKEKDVEELLRRLKIEGSIFEPKLNYIERIR